MAGFPTITQQPIPVRNAYDGQTVTFSCAATSPDDRAVLYWWGYQDAQTGTQYIIPGAQSSSYTFRATIAESTGRAYSCLVRLAGESEGIGTASVTVGFGGGTGTGTDPGGGTGTGTGYIGGDGSSGGSGDVSFGLFANNLGVQGRDFLLDGDYGSAQPCGLAVPTFPFLSQGNTNAVVFRQPFEQAVGSYQAPSMTSAQGSLGGLYFFGDVSFRDGGAGVYTFERTFGNIPARRTRRGQSINYSYQFILVKGAQLTFGDDGSLASYEGPDYSLGTRVYPVDMLEVTDYFLDGQQANYPLRRKPSYELTGQFIGPVGEDFNAPGSFPLMIGPGGLIVAIDGVTQILAEDDRYDEYQGAVKCRVRRIIAAPTVKNFFNSGS